MVSDHNITRRHKSEVLELKHRRPENVKPLKTEGKVTGYDTMKKSILCTHHQMMEYVARIGEL